jgi:hypothetical protein
MERFSLELPASFFVTDDTLEQKPIELITSNICSGGAYFVTSTPFKIGTDVKINITLSLDKIKKLGGKSSRIDVSGSVIRSDEKGMAVRFDNRFSISPYDKYEIQ